MKYWSYKIHHELRGIYTKKTTNIHCRHERRHEQIEGVCSGRGGDVEQILGEKSTVYKSMYRVNINQIKVQTRFLWGEGWRII